MASTKPTGCLPAGKPGAAISDAEFFDDALRTARTLGIADEFEPSIEDDLARIDGANRSAGWKRNERKKLRRRVERTLASAQQGSATLPASSLPAAAATSEARAAPQPMQVDTPELAPTLPQPVAVGAVVVAQARPAGAQRPVDRGRGSEPRGTARATVVPCEV